MRLFLIGFAAVVMALSGCDGDRSVADAGSRTDSGTIPTDSGSDSGPDAGVDSGQVVGIPCSSDLCTAGEERCCFHFTGYTCHPLDEACEGFRVSCDGPEDCSGSQVCCARTAPDAEATCVDVCEPDEEICHTTADCPTGETCCPDPAFAIEGFCRTSCS